MDSVYDNKSRSRVNKIISLLTIVVLSFLIFYFVTYSWFGEEETGSKVMVVGDIKLNVQTNLEFPSKLLEPNQVYDNMLTTITCEEGTDEAYIKVKVETNVQVNGHHVVSPVLYVTDEMTALGKQSWYYSEDDDCYYYVGFVSPTVSATFNTGFVVSNDITNAERNKAVKITITVYAIQRYFKAYESDPDWAQAPSEWKTEIEAYDIVN